MDAVNFKKATLIFLASKIPEKNIDDLRNLFISIDKNGDGKITIDEFQLALKNHNMNFTPTEIMEITYKLDANNNGYVDYTEFIAGCMKSKVYLKDENLKTAFAYFDKVYL